MAAPIAFFKGLTPENLRTRLYSLITASIKINMVKTGMK